VTVLLLLLLAAAIAAGATIISPHLWQWLIVLGWTAAAIYVLFVLAGI
jgi:hypothetical protein